MQVLGVGVDAGLGEHGKHGKVVSQNKSGNSSVISSWYQIAG